MQSAGGHREGVPATVTVFKNLAMILSTTQGLWFMNSVPALLIRSRYYLSNSEHRILTLTQIKVPCRLRSSYLLPVQIWSLKNYEQMDKLCRFFLWEPQLVEGCLFCFITVLYRYIQFLFCVARTFQSQLEMWRSALQLPQHGTDHRKNFLTTKSFHLLFRLILNFPNGSNHVLLSDALIVPYLWSSPKWSKPGPPFVHLGG